MFERYSEQARRSLFFARYEASQLGSIVIDTEHLLLGLLREDTGLTGILFARSRISQNDVRRELERRSVFREKVSTSVEIPFSEQAKRSLQFASEEADRLSHNYIGTEHLLLGMLREEASVAAAALIHRGMRLSAVREELQRLNHPATGIEVDSDTHPAAWWFSVEPEGSSERLRHSNWTLRFRDGGYWFLREGETPEGPYCATCWDTERRWVRMVRDARGEVLCENCGERGRES
jgi:ATP-dependent Clp protease ATP-binding subunit ClpA